MTGASGKRNRMFAVKYIFLNKRWLILFSIVLWVPYSAAQQSQSNDVTADSDENHRVEPLAEVEVEEWEMDLALPAPAPGNSSKTQSLALPDKAQNQQMQRLLSSLAKNPDSQQTLSQLNMLLSDVLDQANQFIDAGSINQAEQLLGIIQSVEPGFNGLSAARKRIQASGEITNLLIAGNAALESGRVLEPQDSSALYYFNQALKKAPQDPAAIQGLTRVQRKLLDLALESAGELDFETADLWLSDAAMVKPDQKAVEDVRTEVTVFRQERATELEEKALGAMASGNFNMAGISIIDLIALGGNESIVTSLRAKLKKARFYGGFVPGQIIRDQLKTSGGTAPGVVVIAQGSYLMGSRDQDHDHEQPLHRVTLAEGFGIGLREVSVEQFQQFVTQSGYLTTAEQGGSSFVYDEAAGRLSRRNGINWRHGYNGKRAKPEFPVLHVSFQDVHAYLQWLSKESGFTYRLPSEAEYEYVARGGSKSTYWWGEGSPPELVENLTGEKDSSPSKRQWSTSFKNYGDGYWGPGPAGSVSNGKLVHPMGVHDIAGNVCEWTEDCWHQNYVKAPADGSAWVNRGCKQRVVRGGYWASAPEKSRAAFRFPVTAESFGPVIGFRVVRDL
jgi:formylglycine-generating enzyme required for sulfatase activity